MSALYEAEIAVFDFDGKGGAVERAGLEGKAPKGGFRWVHVKVDAAEAVLETLSAPPAAHHALLAKETRPRCTVLPEGVLLNLRGVNLNPEQEPEDMVSLRLWLTRDLIVTTWMRPLQGVTDVEASIARGRGPIGPADLVARIALRLADRAEPVIAGHNERIDDIEELEADELDADTKRSLSEVRRSTILLRRYLLPQRDALTTLEIEEVDWLDEPHARGRIREAADRFTRLCEELDAIRDRAQVVSDELRDLRAERMNDRMFLLSVVTAVFLPLGLLTGLLGINVGGMPGTESPYAFWVVVGLMGASAALVIWLLARRGYFR